ncbi:MAG: TerD family protein [Akkermansiaceae bacterium]|nr:TerD family protein [Armatimonadota bacterium]
MGILSQRGGNLSLSKDQPNMEKIIVGLGWDSGERPGEDFDLDVLTFLRDDTGKVRSGFIRILNNATNGEITKYDLISPTFLRVLNNVRQNETIRYELSKDAWQDTAVIPGELYRYEREWKFGALGQGAAGGLAVLVASYGVDIG